MEQTPPKNLQQIAREKVQAQVGQTTTSMPPSVTSTPSIGQQTVMATVVDEKLASLPPNHVMNVIRTLKEKQARQAIWFDFELPSNGKAGYPKDIKLRELTTEDEKTLIKEMFASKDNSLMNVIVKCAKFEGMPDFDFNNLTTFDQDFILVQLSAITFPGEKDIVVTDDANHKIGLKLNKEDLSLTFVPSDAEYPFKVFLPTSGITWYFTFMTLKKVNEVDKAMKTMSNDVLVRAFLSIAFTTEKAEINGQPITFENFYEIVKLLDSLAPSDLKIILDNYNEKSAAYGYKLVKDYYCTDCGKGGQMELEPLNFFRLTV
jgi:hypothetical protein